MRNILLIMVIASVFGCAGRMLDAKSANKCVCEEKNPSQERMKRDSGKVVLVYTRNKDMGALKAGTGFVVDKDGFIMTAKHVVEDPEAEYIFVKIIENGETIIKKAIKAYGSYLHDVAVLKINHTFKKAAKFSKNYIASGSPVYTIDFPLVGEKGLVYAIPAYSSGEFFKNILHGKDNAPTQLSTLPVAPGFSGAPIFDANGDVVGLVSLNFNFALRGSTFVFSVPADICGNVLELVKSELKK